MFAAAFGESRPKTASRTPAEAGGVQVETQISTSQNQCADETVIVSGPSAGVSSPQQQEIQHTNSMGKEINSQVRNDSFPPEGTVEKIVNTLSFSEQGNRTPQPASSGLEGHGGAQGQQGSGSRQRGGRAGRSRGRAGGHPGPRGRGLVKEGRGRGQHTHVVRQGVQVPRLSDSSGAGDANRTVLNTPNLTGHGQALGEQGVDQSVFTQENRGTYESTPVVNVVNGCSVNDTINLNRHDVVSADPALFDVSNAFQYRVESVDNNVGMSPRFLPQDSRRLQVPDDVEGVHQQDVGLQGAVPQRVDQMTDPMTGSSSPILNERVLSTDPPSCDATARGPELLDSTLIGIQRLQARIDNMVRGSWPADLHVSEQWKQLSLSPINFQEIVIVSIKLLIEYVIVVTAWGELSQEASSISTGLALSSGALSILEQQVREVVTNCAKLEVVVFSRHPEMQQVDADFVSAQTSVLLMWANLLKLKIRLYRDDVDDRDSVSNFGSQASSLTLVGNFMWTDDLRKRKQDGKSKMLAFVRQHVRLTMLFEMGENLSEQDIFNFQRYTVERDTLNVSLQWEAQTILSERRLLTEERDRVNSAQRAKVQSVERHRAAIDNFGSRYSDLAERAHSQPQVETSCPQNQSLDDEDMRRRLNRLRQVTPPNAQAEGGHGAVPRVPMPGSAEHRRATQRLDTHEDDRHYRLQADVNAVIRNREHANHLQVPVQRGPSQTSTPRSGPPSYREVVNPNAIPREYSRVPVNQQGSDNVFVPSGDVGRRDRVARPQAQHAPPARVQPRVRVQDATVHLGQVRAGAEATPNVSPLSYPENPEFREPRYNVPIDRCHSYDRSRDANRNPFGFRATTRRGDDPGDSGDPSSSTEDSERSRRDRRHHGAGGGGGGDGGRGGRGNRRNRRGGGDSSSPPSSSPEDEDPSDHVSESDRSHRRRISRRSRWSQDESDYQRSRGRQDRSERQGERRANTMNDSAFRTETDRNRFQRSLRSPWNVPIKSSAKQSEEYNLIKQTFAQKERKFNGENDYFKWRGDAIQFINQANIPVAAKIICLRDACSFEENSLLGIIFNSTRRTKGEYRRIIFRLEDNWGGEERALRYVQKELYNAGKVNISDYTSCLATKSKLARFISHLRSSRMEAQLDQRVTVQRVFEALLSPVHVKMIYKDHKTGLLTHDIDSVYIVKEWLDHIVAQFRYLHEKTPEESLKKSTSVPAKPAATRARPFARRPMASTMLTMEDGGDSPYVEDDSYLDEDAPDHAGGEVVTDASSPPGEEDQLSQHSDVDENELIDCDDMEHIPTHYTFLTQKFSAKRFIDCGYCKKERKQTVKHPVWRCPEFLKLSVKGRRTWVQADKRCVNCLSNGHTIGDCKSKYNCKTCGKRHANALHDSQSK